MRILIVSQTYEPDANGQAVFTTHLAEGLTDAGHQVSVILPADHWRYEQSSQHHVSLYRIDAIAFRPWYPEVRFTPWPQRRIAEILDRFQPDIVHLQDHYPLARSAFKAARHRSVPVVGTNHFLPENVLQNLPFPRGMQKTLKHLLWWSMRLTYDHLDIVTTPTETAAHILLQQGLWPPIRPISCGVDLSFFSVRPGLDRRTLRGKYGFTATHTLFLYVGRVDHEKRLDVLLHALYHLQRSDVQVGIIGKGLHQTALKKLAKDLHLEGQVVFTGYVPSGDLPLLLNSADVFVMPSEAELQSIATLEAMASGLPVLAANKHALPELVENGVNGYLFHPGDAKNLARRMEQILAQRDDWPAMGRASRQKAAKHDFAATVQAYQAVYQRVLAVHAGQRISRPLFTDFRSDFSGISRFKF